MVRVPRQLLTGSCKVLEFITHPKIEPGNVNDNEVRALFDGCGAFLDGKSALQKGHAASRHDLTASLNAFAAF
jgi:hypothetical protein